MDFKSWFKYRKNDNKVIEEVAKKYLEEHINQLRRLDRVDLVALPSLVSAKDMGKKELPLSIAIKEAYSINPTVFACVNAIASSAAMVPFILHELDDDGQYTHVFKDPILNLLNNPNNLQTQPEFIKTIVLDLCLCGNALVWKNTSNTKNRDAKFKASNPVTELIILNPDHIEYTQDGFEITGYKGREKSPLDGNAWTPDEIIHFRLTNPNNPFWGMSPIQAAYRAIDVDSQILAWWINTMQFGCKKDALIKFKHDLTDTQYRRIRALVDAQVAGFRNGRGYMILGHEVDMEFLDHTPAELDFTKSRQMSSREIMAIFRVPPPLLGDTDGGNPYNNRKEIQLAFWLDTIMPYLNDICAVLTKRLLPHFKSDEAKFIISYDPTDVDYLQPLITDRWDCIAKMVNVGVPLNMAIKTFKLQIPSIAGGDVGYMSHNLVPMGFYQDKQQKTELVDETVPGNPFSL